jgi:hypothetical protein
MTGDSDVRALERRLAALAAHDAVARVACAAPPHGDLVEGVLGALCEHLGWSLALVWTPDDTGERLRVLTGWCTPALADDEIWTRSIALTIPTGVGLPGRVWASGQPVAAEDLSLEASFARAIVAEEAGIRSAYAFPLRGRTGPLGVVELLGERFVPVDGDLALVLCGAAAHVAQAVAQLDGERARRHSDEVLRALSNDLRTSLQAVLGWTDMLERGAVDEDGARKAFAVIARNTRAQAQVLAEIARVIAARGPC